MIGAIIGGADDKDAALLYEFGSNLGLAFQIQDDLLDVYGDVNIFGKISGGDIVTNKKTFLLIKALELATGNTLMKLQEQVQVKEFNPEDKVKTVMDIFDQLNIRSITENLANDYITKSLSQLEKVKADKERKNELYQMATSLIGRSK
jgi:geranylgeranyl diphosphate synthase type II